MSLIYECLQRLGASGIRETAEGYEALCPFHHSTSGKKSFRVAHVSSNKKQKGRPGAWRCHNANCWAHQGGYLESLVMHAFSVPYKEACEIVRDQGHTYEKPPEPEWEEPEPARLWPHVGRPCAYLLDRGLSQQDIDHYSIGYNERTNQIVIPTFSVDDKLVGLTHREAKPGAIYYHTRFKKSEHLWGLHKWQPGEAITLCEGQLDPVGLRPHWEGTICAQMGSSLSEDQAGLISERTDTAYLCYDNDEAGVLATFGAIDMLREAGLTDIYILGYNAPDPADLTRRHGEITNIERSGRWIANHL